ncbi:MAG: hypothetical protein LW878_09095, partial [Proteobacteria bacterium]|nr:hypothetical protein [Pseudomonadota bacterium]
SYGEKLFYLIHGCDFSQKTSWMSLAKMRGQKKREPLHGSLFFSILLFTRSHPVTSYFHYTYERIGSKKNL